MREYGWTPQARYVSQAEGMNSRLDELQAAILRVKLRHLDKWNDRRRTLAARYAQGLPAAVIKPVEQPGCHHVYHLYVVRVAQRDDFRQQLQQAGIGTAIHYPLPIHQQPAYVHLPTTTLGQPLTETERIAHEIVSLPLHPHLTTEQVDQVCRTIASATLLS